MLPIVKRRSEPPAVHMLPQAAFAPIRIRRTYQNTYETTERPNDKKGHPVGHPNIYQQYRLPFHFAPPFLFGSGILPHIRLALVIAKIPASVSLRTITPPTSFLSLSADLYVSHS